MCKIIPMQRTKIIWCLLETWSPEIFKCIVLFSVSLWCKWHLDFQKSLQVFIHTTWLWIKRRKYTVKFYTNLSFYIDNINTYMLALQIKEWTVYICMFRHSLVTFFQWLSTKSSSFQLTGIKCKKLWLNILHLINQKIFILICIYPTHTATNPNIMLSIKQEFLPTRH